MNEKKNKNNIKKWNFYNKKKLEKCAHCASWKAAFAWNFFVLITKEVTYTHNSNVLRNKNHRLWQRNVNFF